MPISQAGVEAFSFENDGLVWYVTGDLKDCLDEITKISEAVAPVSYKPYMAFGEAVLHMKRLVGKRKLPKYEGEWGTGVFVGLVERINELCVLTPNDAIRVISVRRLPPPQRRDPELLKAVVRWLREVASVVPRAHGLRE